MSKRLDDDWDEQTNQDKLLDFVNDPTNIAKAVEGSMEKRNQLMSEPVSLEDKIDEIVPKCINPNCDNQGSIPEQVGEDEWVQAQCEYCFTVRFPMREALLTLVKTEVEKTKYEVLKNLIKRQKNFIGDTPIDDTDFSKGMDSEARATLGWLEDNLEMYTPEELK